MKNKNTISVVVPIYNVENYLEECVDSIINQTYKDLEIILVDDGATDNSGKICDEYKEKDERIIVIHKENGGLSSARNEGMKIANGEYITFIDSDDYIEPTMYDELINLIQNHNADIVACDLQPFIDGEKKLIKNKNEKLFIFNSNDALFEMFKNNSINWCAYCKLYKKELFNDVFYPEGMLCEDKATTYKIYKKINKMVYTTKRFYHYRLRKTSITGLKTIKYYVDTMNINHELEEELGSIDETLGNYAKAYTSKSSLLYVIDTYGNNEYKEIYENALNELKEKYKYVKYGKFMPLYMRLIIYICGVFIKKNKDNYIIIKIMKTVLKDWLHILR